MNSAKNVSTNECQNLKPCVENFINGSHFMGFRLFPHFDEGLAFSFPFLVQQEFFLKKITKKGRKKNSSTTGLNSQSKQRNI